MDEKVIARFWVKVDKDGPTHPTLGTACWIWLAGTSIKGYGRIIVSGRVRFAHRLAWELAHGPIPDGLQVLHKCDTPRCVRAEGHLFLGTNADNNADMMAKGRHVPNPLKPGEDHLLAKLTETDVRQIRALGSDITQRQIAARFGVSQSMVHRIQSRKAWFHI